MGLVWCIKLAASYRQINGKYVSNRPKLVHQRGKNAPAEESVRNISADEVPLSSEAAERPQPQVTEKEKAHLTNSVRCSAK